MEPNQNKNPEVVETTQTSADYIAAIQQLKATTVSKEEYDALAAEKKQLLDSIVNGTAAATESEQNTPDYEAIKKECRTKLFAEGSELNNLEYCKTALELREAVLKSEGVDIFVGSGHNLTPTNEDYDKAQRVADVMQECIDEAGGNSDIFTAQLMTKTNDVMKLPGNNNKNRPVRR